MAGRRDGGAGAGGGGGSGGGAAACVEAFTCSDDRTVCRVDVSAGSTGRNPAVRDRWTDHTRSVSRLAYGPTSDVLYSCARDLTIRQWRRGAPACVQTIQDGHDLNITAIALSPDERLLCSGSRDTAVCLWDTATGQRAFRKKTSRNLVTCLAWSGGSGGGSVVVQGSEDLKLRLWDVRDRSLSPSQTLTGFVYFALCVDVSADGRYVCTGSKGFDGVGCEVRVWDRRQGKCLHNMDGHRQSTVGCAFLGGGSGSGYVASVAKDQSIRVWDAQGACVQDALGCTGGPFTCLSAAAAPPTAGGGAGDGGSGARRLFAGSSTGFSVYDWQEEKLSHTASFCTNNA